MGTEIRGLRESEMEAHAELVYLSYLEYAEGKPGLADPHWWLKSVRADPYYDPDVTRVLFLDGRMVASVTNFDRWVYVGDGRRARVGCIGSVCTHPDFRRRGLVRQVLAECVEWMLTNGFHWSSLFGREEVYGGSGWTVLTSFTCSAELRVRDEFGSNLTIRRADPEADAATLTRLYERFAAGLTGPVVRNEAYWRQVALAPQWGTLHPYYLLEADGQPMGYFSGEDGRLREVAWVDRAHDVVACLLRRWEGQPVQFPLATPELIQLLREVSHVRRAAEVEGGITLSEAYKGLWRYIGPGGGEFPEISDTESMKRFLRDRAYCFWSADGY